MNEHTSADSISGRGDPLCFLLSRGAGNARASGERSVVKVEARRMGGHQKEAVVRTDDGNAWRLTSDEGKHLRGTDLAPFPLGYFNAGMQSDLYGRISALAAEKNIKLRRVAMRLVNHYWLTGSFILGTGEGHAESPDIDVQIDGDVSAEQASALVAAAMDASPAVAFVRGSLTANTFALYINGRRRNVADLPGSPEHDAPDPFLTYRQAPRPLDANARRDLIEKTGLTEPGQVELASATVTNKLIRDVVGEGSSIGTDGMYASETWLGMPGTSHFRIVSDESGNGNAPSGLELLSAGISFCYMTQLARYIESMKMDIHGVRLVQLNPFVAGARAVAEPIETHLFLNGEAPPETHLQLLTIAARTCYLHAASKTPTEPNVRIALNGQHVARAA